MQQIVAGTMHCFCDTEESFPAYANEISSSSIANQPFTADEHQARKTKGHLSLMGSNTSHYQQWMDTSSSVDFNNMDTAQRQEKVDVKSLHKTVSCSSFDDIWSGIDGTEEGDENPSTFCMDDAQSFAETDSNKKKKERETPNLSNLVSSRGNEQQVQHYARGPEVHGKESTPDTSIASHASIISELTVGKDILAIVARDGQSQEQQSYYTNRLRANVQRLQYEISNDKETLLKSLRAPPLKNTPKIYRGLPNWMIVGLGCVLTILIGVTTRELVRVVTWHREQVKLYDDYQRLHAP